MPQNKLNPASLNTKVAKAVNNITGISITTKISNKKYLLQEANELVLTFKDARQTNKSMYVTTQRPKEVPFQIITHAHILYGLWLSKVLQK